MVDFFLVWFPVYKVRIKYLNSLLERLIFFFVFRFTVNEVCPQLCERADMLRSPSISSNTEGEERGKRGEEGWRGGGVGGGGRGGRGGWEGRGGGRGEEGGRGRDGVLTIWIYQTPGYAL